MNRKLDFLEALMTHVIRIQKRWKLMIDKQHRGYTVRSWIIKQRNVEYARKT